MSKFAKSKMHFTLALLGVLFATHPFVEHMTRISFSYLGHDLPILYPTILMAGLLGLAAFFFASDLTDNRVGGLSKRIGNLCYALAIMVMPAYLGLYCSNQIEDFAVTRGWVSADKVNRTTSLPVEPSGVFAIWFVLFVGASAYLRHRMAHKEWASQVEELVDQEIEAVKRAKMLLEMEHYDLAVIHCHKAVMARLRAALTKRGYSVTHNEAKVARKLGILNIHNDKLYMDITHWAGKATGHQPTPEVIAKEIKQFTRDLLSTIPV